ncbi:class I SAM-dependent methyltransferase [Cognatishimia sp. MH4019]|uniref:class I SAM-dependent methyltransferase n=1 Tax=Cognatishimia sp. MH4019 TaxID=2854030 RepID=UPI001CD70D5C|nr:class I SAM-dependent methyltransferase [Cognatishimia sp. MH4019]
MKDHLVVKDTLEECRCCKSSDLITFLPMGKHPPANMFVRPEELNEAQPSFALNSQACLSCGLIQVADQIPQDFFVHYLYVPSSAQTMHAHFEDFAKVLGQLADGGLIMDIGCNDGLMLSFANAQGAKTLGIDPAANLAKIAAERGVEVHVAYLSPESAHEVVAKHGPAQVIATSNTFNHIGDLHGFMEAVDILLAEDGTFVIEVPWGKEIVETNEFDNIYHEHMSELSLLSIIKLGKTTGFDVVDVTKLPVHGGSMRVFLRKAVAKAQVAPIVTQMVEEERAAGMLDRASYEAFATRVNDDRTALLDLLASLKAEGKTIAGYGAPAKGNTLLNFFGIGPDTLEFLADRNPLKQGLFAPGSKIPILAPEAIAERKPDYLLVLAWNFFDEIREQLTDFEAAGGRFIVPLPNPTVVGGSGTD